MMMNNTIKKRFFVGDEWLYYKIYCGFKVSDTILIEIIKPFTEKLLKEGYIEKWFFIRYEDPNYHLRFRIKVLDKKNIGYIINNFNNLIEKFIKSKLIWSLKMDCYDREIERYGADTMELSEDFFFNDSVVVVNYLSESIKGRNENKISKPLFSLKMIDFYLTNIGFSTPQKLNLMEKLRSLFYKEFEINKDNKKQVEKIYSNNKADIYVELLNPLDSIVNLNINENLTKIIEVLKSQNTEDMLYNLSSSYIHMFLNRLYYSNNRIHELVCYDILWRFYKFKINN